MINLIPNEEKKKMIKGYYLRLLVVYLIILSSSILVGVALMIPSYFVVYSREALADRKLNEQKNELVPTSLQQTPSAMTDLGKKLDLIERVSQNKFVVSEKIINALLLKKSSRIKITKISYENDPRAGKKISVQGTAGSREDLLSFRKTLENDIAFKKVELPISNFVKGSNVSFYLSLTPS